VVPFELKDENSEDFFHAFLFFQYGLLMLNVTRHGPYSLLESESMPSSQDVCRQ
jgi:hypothetical protein